MTEYRLVEHNNKYYLEEKYEWSKEWRKSRIDLYTGLEQREPHEYGVAFDNIDDAKDALEYRRQEELNHRNRVKSYKMEMESYKKNKKVLDL